MIMMQVADDCSSFILLRHLLMQGAHPKDDTPRKIFISGGLRTSVLIKT